MGRVRHTDKIVEQASFVIMQADDLFLAEMTDVRCVLVAGGKPRRLPFPVAYASIVFDTVILSLLRRGKLEA